MFLHSVNLWNLAFYVFMVFLATLGLWDVFFGFEENKCSMSYMFEYPEYQSSAVPKTWVSTDHLSIVWCKQLQLTTVRAFFDLIDADTKQITQNSKKKLSVLYHHFIRHPSKHFEENPAIISDLTGTSMWVLVKVSKWTYVAYNESEKIYFTFPLENHRKIYTHVYCQSTMLDTNSWIFACIN
ncbi:post-GPI attachment to proteins inositol deacylase 1, partial [Homo sapiens]